MNDFQLSVQSRRFAIR